MPIIAGNNIYMARYDAYFLSGNYDSISLLRMQYLTISVTFFA